MPISTLEACSAGPVGRLSRQIQSRSHLYSISTQEAQAPAAGVGVCVAASVLLDLCLGLHTRTSGGVRLGTLFFTLRLRMRNRNGLPAAVEAQQESS